MSVWTLKRYGQERDIGTGCANTVEEAAQMFRDRGNSGLDLYLVEQCSKQGLRDVHHHGVNLVGGRSHE